MPHILLVDDELGLEGTIPLFLSKRGHKITVAVHGREAIELLRERAFDLILLDLVLPDFSGLEVLGYVKQLRPEIPVIIITGRGTVPLAVEAMRRGACDFLTKPIEMSKLLQAIRRALTEETLGIPEGMRELSYREREVLALLARGQRTRR